jgi:hypothetical protein
VHHLVIEILQVKKIPLGRGYDAARTFLRDKTNKAIRESLMKEIKKIMDNGGLSFAGKEEADEEPEE